MATKPLPSDDKRLTLPLLTRREVAHYVDVPQTTLRNWITGYEFPVVTGKKTSAPIVHTVPNVIRGRPDVPFIGLVEALVLAGFRRKHNLSMQKIRKALDALEWEIGVKTALANRALYTDGAQILWDYAKKTDDQDIQELVEPGTGQKVFVEPVRQYLELIAYDADLWASQVTLPEFQPTVVVIDLNRAFGGPVLDQYRVRVEDITDRFYRGKDSIGDIAADLEIPPAEVENVIRVAGPTAIAA